MFDLDNFVWAESGSSCEVYEGPIRCDAPAFATDLSADGDGNGDGRPAFYCYKHFCLVGAEHVFIEIVP